MPKTEDKGGTPEKRTHKKRERRPTSEKIIAFGISVPPLPDSAIPLVSPDLSLFPNPTDYPWIAAQAQLQEQASQTGQMAGGVELTVTEAPANVAAADFAVACHRLAKPLSKSPGAIAAELAANYNAQPSVPFVKKADATPTGYLNFELDIQPFGNAVLEAIEGTGANYGHENIGNGEIVILDCSSPNVAKYMSVGHLRSTVIGESLARIYKASGYQAIRDNHLGDWGTQFGMLGRAKELWGDEIDRELPDAEPVQKLYRLYVKMHEEIEKEKKLDPDGESTLEKEGRAWFQRLEAGEPAARALLDECTTLSIKEFQRIYGILGSQYEYSLGESFYVGMLPDLLHTLEQKGIAKQDERGVLVVKFPEKPNLNDLVVQKSDGASVYATRDLATLAARTAWFHPDKILYVVGGDQKQYFNQVFAAFEQLAEGQSPTLEHIAFGLIMLPEGKMSTRKGRVIFLEDVLDDAISRAKGKIQHKRRTDSIESVSLEQDVDLQISQDAPATLNEEGRLTDEEIDTIARQVGVGAVIYMDLGQSRERNIKFDWEQALSLDGNSGLYIQYAHTRGKSILRKAEEGQITIDYTQEATFNLPVEAELVRHLSKFPTVIAKATEMNEPSLVATYTYKAAELYSRFYKIAPVLREADEDTRNSRLRLTAATAQVIENGLYLLGIEAPEKM